MPFDVEGQNLAPLLAALDAYPDIARPILEDASSAALLGLIPGLADYPPAPASSNYRRTGLLGRLWTSARPEFAPLSSGFEASIGTARPGGEFVQGELQAAVHQGRWPTVDEVIARRQADIEAYFEAALQRITEAIDAKAGS